MGFWIDRNGSARSAATHALIVGTSYYSDIHNLSGGLKFNLPQLDCAASAALRVAIWLRDYYRSDAPLGSIQLLVSPSPAETASTPELAYLPRATRANVHEAIFEWKRRCSADRNGVAILYIAGHGVACSDEHGFVLLEDFASTPAALESAIDINIIRSGMLEEEIAQTQLYFVDACRIPMDEFRKFRNLGHGIMLPGSADVPDRRCCPVYFSAAPGTRAYGEERVGTLFSQALIECLNLHAAREPESIGSEWQVTTSSLEEALEPRVRDIAGAAGVEQMVVVGGQRRVTQIHRYQTPPMVPVSIRLQPREAQEFVHAKLSDSNGVCVLRKHPFEPNPISWQTPAGLYSMDVLISPEGSSSYHRIRGKLFAAKPPSTGMEAFVG